MVRQSRRVLPFMTRRAMLLTSSATLAACSTSLSGPGLNTASSFGQGLMTGEVTASTAMLQTRTTGPVRGINGRPEGRAAIVRFEWKPEGAEQWTPTDPILTSMRQDFIARLTLRDLMPDQPYLWRAVIEERDAPTVSPQARFRTYPGGENSAPVAITFTSCPHYYRFFHGRPGRTQAYQGPDKELGYPALATLIQQRAEHVVINGDVVYYDHPNLRDARRAAERDIPMDDGGYGWKEATTLPMMRAKFQEQFSLPRFRQLAGQASFHFLKDDHDYRWNDSFPGDERDLPHDLGVATFREQMPILPAEAPANAKTYRTIRASRDVQLWFLEGRDYRTDNTVPDGPDKTLWGVEQREWLKRTLVESDAAIKVLVTPTPLIGPDDAYKTDNHTNKGGFRYEGQAFLTWLEDQGFDPTMTFIITGDRHWQYHARHPSGFQEFSSGALDSTNARAGRLSGDPESTDPDGEIEQFYVQGEADKSGGFLNLSVERQGAKAKATLAFYNEFGQSLYTAQPV